MTANLTCDFNFLSMRVHTHIYTEQELIKSKGRGNMLHKFNELLISISSVIKCRIFINFAVKITSLIIKIITKTMHVAIHVAIHVAMHV